MPAPFTIEHQLHHHMHQRVQQAQDLVERGYEDAHRLFIEPALGAAGERVRGTTW